MSDPNRYHASSAWLANWDQKSCQVPIFEHFDLLLFGHVHNGWPVFTKNPIGECILAQAGCIYESKDYYNGYQIIDVGTKTREFIFKLRSFFNEPARRFGAAENIAKDGIKEFAPQGEGRRTGTLTVRDLSNLQLAIEQAGDAHVAVIQRDQNRRFDAYLNLHHWVMKAIRLQRVCRQRIIVGTCLKLSKLFRAMIARMCSDTNGANFKIPVFVDFTSIKSYESLDRIVRRSMTRLNVDIPARTVLKSHSCLFIVDKVKLGDISRLQTLQRLIKALTNVQHSCVIMVYYDGLNIEEKIKNVSCSDRRIVFIESLSRSQVRSLISRINPVEVLSRTVIPEDILKLISDNRLPQTAYIVSLLKPSDVCFQ